IRVQFLEDHVPLDFERFGPLLCTSPTNRSPSFKSSRRRPETIAPTNLQFFSCRRNRPPCLWPSEIRCETIRISRLRSISGEKIRFMMDALKLMPRCLPFAFPSLLGSANQPSSDPVSFRRTKNDGAITAFRAFRLLPPILRGL